MNLRKSVFTQTLVIILAISFIVLPTIYAAKNPITVQFAYHRDFTAVICPPTLHKKVPVPRTSHYIDQITPEGAETQIVAEYLRKYIGKVETLKETKATFKNIMNMLNRRPKYTPYSNIRRTRTSTKST